MNVQIEVNKIYNMDCLQGLKMLPDNCVDLIITSPPYNLGTTHHTNKNRFKAYNEYDDNMEEAEYQKWQELVLRECYRVLTKNGSMFYNHKNRIKNGKQIEPYRWIYNTPFIIKQEIVWQNGTHNFDKIRFYPTTERIYWLTKDVKTKLFNKISHNDFFNSSEWKPVKTKGEFKRAYPEKMIEDIISCFDDAHIVLDPFSGSGTTCYVAKKMGKQYIGFELSCEYCKMAEERIENEKI